MKRLILLTLLLIGTPVFAANLDEMIGQMIIVGFKGDNINSKGFHKILKQINTNEISGVIVFEDNIKNNEDFLQMTTAIQNSKSKYKPFIGIDQEGGKVQRMNKNNGYKDFPTAKNIAQTAPQNAYNEYFEMAKILKGSNININFAPCIDLAINKDSIIEKKERSYSDNPQIVSMYATEFINAHTENKIITSIKHFPGHGSPKGDTHKGFVDITKTHLQEEIIPFVETANVSPLEMVMVSHLYNKNIDKNYPASLSKATIDFLKNETKFDGIVITDDLDMGAVRKNYQLKAILTKISYY